MVKVIDKESWITKSSLKHNNKYDYSLVEYTGSKNRVSIICPTHGIFSQVANQHAYGTGCIKCGKTWNTEKFIKVAKTVHGEKYDYLKSNYTRMKDPIIITCKTHGDFVTKPLIHIGGSSCPKCKMVLLEDFIKRSNMKHKHKYIYDETLNYTKVLNKVNILCLDHGYFQQRAEAHMDGQGCPKCASSLNLHKRIDWCKKYSNQKTSLYVVKCWNDTEEFYKIGISGNFKLRYDSKTKMPYKYNIVAIIDSMNPAFIWDLEKKLLKFNQVNRYVPNIKFGGCKECFSIVDMGNYNKFVPLLQ